MADMNDVKNRLKNMLAVNEENCFLSPMTRIAKMRAILYVPRNLPQRKTSILWQCMEKG